MSRAIQLGTPFYITIEGDAKLGGFWNLDLVNITVVARGSGVRANITGSEVAYEAFFSQLHRPLRNERGRSPSSPASLWLELSCSSLSCYCMPR